MDIDAMTRERAYLMWEQAGKPDGQSEAFWLAAADSLAREMAATAAAAQEPPAKAVPRRAAAVAEAAPRKAGQPAKRPVLVVAAATDKAPAPPTAMVRR